ncbi:Mth938-like domain-containing protein [Variovorax dokdonensis]|uniref:Mth938-like domain-containing protein n=1 Tax=Variovorax dokdonensis TaxID=344883 RepID=A0ABT7NEE4_9BURK|nr:Mth938-like domain-containing protein [Variovorax dokdonensis]MDM0046316.1 Mth938-like domain-containing protein [Variovorax dokdonensis]
MKLQPDKSDAPTLTAHGPGWVAINNEKVTRSVVVGSHGERMDWQCSRFEDLEARHFEQLAGLDAELIIFGSGSRIRFPRPAWLRALIERRTGVETMDTPAACRTYNILASEGRHVVVALLIEDANQG